MNPLAPTAADTHHLDTAEFIRPRFLLTCPGCRAINRAPGVSF